MLTQCINLGALNIRFHLCLTERPNTRNSVSFATAYNIIQAACYRAPLRLRKIETRIYVDEGPAAVDVHRVHTVAHLARLRWESLEDALETFCRRREELTEQEGIVFRIVHDAKGDGEMFCHMDLKPVVQRLLSTEACSVL